MAAGPARDRHRQGLGARVAFEGVRQMGGGGHSGARPVPDEPAQQDQGAVVVGGAEVCLVGDPLGVEGEQVAEDGDGVEESHGRVVGGAYGEPAEGRVRG